MLKIKMHNSSKTMTSKLHLLALFFLMSALTPAFGQVCDCVTTGNCPVPINDNGTYNGTLDVTVDGANDLGDCPLTSVCFSITHTWIGDLSVSLTSPSGVSYLLMADANNNFGGCGMQEDNIEVCIVTGTGNPLTNNTEYICNPGPCDAGTCCLTGNWTVACGGVTDPITMVPEAPNCDLDDFNVPGDPANGTWTLTVNDVCNMDTGTLDNFILNFACGISSCIVCEADGAVIDTASFISCEGNPNLLLNLPPDYGAMPPPPDTSYSYGYVISQGGTILSFDSLPDLTGQPAGVYQVHGFSYYTSDSLDLPYMIGLDTALIDTQLISTTAPFCGDLSDNFVTVTIEPPVAPTVIDTTVCAGGCIDVGGNSVCASDTITLSTWLGCDSLIYVNLNELTVTADISPAASPTLTCLSPTVTLDASGSLPGTVTYAWTGPGTFSSTDPTITVSTAGTYTLVVSDNSVTPACTDMTSITVNDGVVPPDLAVSGAPQICNGENFDLSTLTVTDGNNTNPTITFHDGTPATPINELSSTVVSPTATTTYYVLAVTGTCSDEEPVTVTVNDPPTADFTVVSPICVNGSTTVIYTGNGGPGATYAWNFGGGVPTPGTGPGPHDVSWLGTGTYTISLFVSENGCVSNAFSENVVVEAPMPAPVISCNTTTESVEFTWADVPGATGYTLNVISTHIGSMNGNSFLVTGLSPGETVTIEVIAFGDGVCGNSSAQQSCTAQDCPAVTVDVMPVSDICLTADATPFDLDVTVNGGDGTGTLTVDGDGISDSALGTFDPQQANIGVNSVTATYTQGNCIFSENINIYVFQTPTADFTVTSGLCEGEASTVTYTGTAPAGSTYNWDFDGGTATPATGPGPHDVIWPTAGNYTVTLSVDSPDGCPSEVETADVGIDAPLATPTVNCDVTTSSVTFTWTADPDVVTYNVTPISAHTGTLTGTSYEVSGLLPDEMVEIELEAVGAGACGNVTVQQACTSQDCPDVNIAIDAVADICTDASTVPFDLSATITGGSPMGFVTWSGPGIIDDQLGTFDPMQANAGANTITLSYEESTCFFSENISINVFETPQGSITSTPQVCVSSPSTISFTGDPTGLSFNWNFGGGSPNPGTGAGPHEVTWAGSGSYTVELILIGPDGCASQTLTTDVQVDDPLQTPIIDCSATTSSIEFTWANVPGSTQYTVDIPTGQLPTTFTQNSYLFTGLAPEEIVELELTVSNAGTCPPVSVLATCNALPCPDITVDIAPVSDICLGNAQPVQLVETVTGSDGSGAGVWSGDGIDPATGQFDPTAVSEGEHVLTYTFTEQTCVFEDSVAIGVYQTPTADFTADAAICMSDAATVTFEGVAGANANYTWNFGGAIAIPGTGAGPHQLTWDSPGAKTITLTVEENGCASQIFTQDVQVDEELEQPTLVCNATTESVEFIWADVPNATDYLVAVITGGMGTIVGNSYIFTGLNPGEEVAIQLTVLGNTNCPPPVATATCSAQACPPIVVEVLPVDPICLTDNNSQVQLQANLTGADGTGTGTWSGTGVIDPVNGIFDPAFLGAGDYTVSYTYQQVNCSYTEETVISLMPPPVADAGEDYTLSCWESEAEYRLGGNANSQGLEIEYQWTADVGVFPDNPAMLHPTVDMPGTYTLTVTNTLLGCSASDEVVVSSIQDLPIPALDVQQFSCQGENDAMASILGVTGGMEPYLFSLNGEPYVDADTFPFLDEGDYELSVIDAAGCESAVEFTIQPPADVSIELTTNLVGRPLVELGESIQLLTISSLPVGVVDSIVWTPAELLNCTDCFNPLATPEEETEFTVTVYLNGCEASDKLTIYVESDSPIYVPTAFSPNNDGTNDFFTVYPGPQVELVKTFLVFDRWGEMVFEFEDFVPGSPAQGWDGRLDGEPLNPAVFVWFAEVELKDGSTQLLEGEVILVR